MIIITNIRDYVPIDLGYSQIRSGTWSDFKIFKYIYIIYYFIYLFTYNKITKGDADNHNKTAIREYQLTWIIKQTYLLL